MEIFGIPSTFWIVKKPTPASRVEDLCAECSFTRFALLLQAGLRFKDLAGLYAQKDDALALRPGTCPGLVPAAGQPSAASSTPLFPPPSKSWECRRDSGSSPGSSPLHG